jgi:membrane protein involved in colicin uptake
MQVIYLIALKDPSRLQEVVDRPKGPYKASQEVVQAAAAAKAEKKRDAREAAAKRAAQDAAPQSGAGVDASPSHASAAKNAAATGAREA